MPTLLIYGANGYTGELIAREAVRQGMRPVLGARNADRLAPLGGELGLECRAFSLESGDEIERGLAGVAAVLNCAGPFLRTAWPLIAACLRRGVHYLDITGEIGQFERLAARDEEAKRAGAMMLPGVGFDVVPSDCLAAHLKQRLPSANRLVLGVRLTGGISGGTATTMVENAHLGAMVRRAGRIVTIPAASLSRQIDFGRGSETAVIMPWGDVATAYYSTRIPDIEVYFAFPAALRRALLVTRYLGPLLRLRRTQRVLTAAVRTRPRGPNEEQRAQGYSLVWGEASDGSRTARSLLRTPESYELTALTAVNIAQKVMAGNVKPGFQTPSLAYGADLVLETPGVARSDFE